MAPWAPLIIYPTAHVGAVFFIILILSDSGAAKGSAAIRRRIDPNNLHVNSPPRFFGQSQLRILY